MAVVVTVRAPDGVRIGQCSASCYDAAPGTRCRCVCGGLCHGVGRTVAMLRCGRLVERYASAELHPESRQGVFSGILDSYD